MYTVELVPAAERKIVGPVLHSSFVENRQGHEVPEFFHRIMENGALETVPNRANTNQICAFIKPEKSPEFDYYMGVEVENFDVVPEGMQSPDHSGLSRCATITLVKRGNKDVMVAMRYLLEEWIPKNGFATDYGVPAFIYYDDRFLPIFKEKGYEGNPVAQLYIPVKKAA